jgi:hypothetical protein
MKTIGVLFVVLLAASLAGAQQRWTKTYGGTANDAGYSVQQTSDTGYVVTGYTNSFGAGGEDVYLVKVNASGDAAWSKAFGGLGGDYGYSVQQTSDGGYIIAGITLSFGAGFRDIYVIKTDASGDTLWTRTYGGANDDHGYSVQQTLDGGYIVAGGTNSFGAAGFDVYLVKTNASGDTIWTRRYGMALDEEGYSVQQTSDTGYIIAGYTASFGAGRHDVYLIKTKANGDTVWTRNYSAGFAAEGQSVQQTSDSGYVIAGFSYPSAPRGYDFFLVKTNALGDTLWTRSYEGNGTDYGYSGRQTADGGYIITGLTYNNPAFMYVYTIRTNAGGDTLWTKTYGGGGEQRGNSVQQTLDGGFVVAGYTSSFGAGNYDVYLIKTDANGSAGVEEPASGKKVAAGSIMVAPNPFVSFARVPGHEAERFDLYDISGKMVGKYRGDRIGEGLSPAVYFVKLDTEPGRSLRVVKVATRGD